MAVGKYCRRKIGIQIHTLLAFFGPHHVNYWIAFAHMSNANNHTLVDLCINEFYVYAVLIFFRMTWWGGSDTQLKSEWHKYIRERMWANIENSYSRRQFLGRLSTIQKETVGNIKARIRYIISTCYAYKMVTTV